MSGGVVVVTGGLSGIGAAAAQYLADQRRTVIVLDRNIGGVPEGVTLHGDSVDITDEAGLRRAFEKVESRHGPVTGLVNAAGVLGKMHRPERLKLSDWENELSVDLKGTFIACRTAGKLMCERRHGAIVNIGSIAGMFSAPVHAYGPAKAGVISLTATLAAEWGREGVRVNCVSPGFTETPALLQGLTSGALDRDRLTSSAAMGRLVRPREVAAAIAWLLGEESSAITGVNLPVDAGWIAGVTWATYGGFRSSEKGSIE
jgi:NAD(P)-dependent dehydrogenase (short-subunit alcohol dehydrogenase family)